MTAEYTPQGNIGKYSDEWIEASLDWTGRKGFLIECLVNAGWLDYECLPITDPLPTHSEWAGNRKLFVHDWVDHADSATRKRNERAGLPFLGVSGKVTGQCSVTDWTTAASRARDPNQPKPIHTNSKPQIAEPAPVKVPHGEFPLVGLAVRERFPEADDTVIMKITIAVGQKVAGANGNIRGQPTDALIADAQDGFAALLGQREMDFTVRR